MAGEPSFASLGTRSSTERHRALPPAAPAGQLSRMTSDAPPPDSPAAHLAARFASDAQALRRRAEQLDAARRSGGRPQPGPDAAGCRRMADACDRVATLFASATDDDTLGALEPILEQLVADARTPDVRHVHEGALARLREALGEDDEDEDDDVDDDDQP